MMTSTNTTPSPVVVALQSVFALLVDLTPKMHSTDNRFTVGDVTVAVQSGKYSWYDSALMVTVNDWSVRKLYKPRRYTKFDAANVQKIADTIRDIVSTAAAEKARKTAQYDEDAARYQRITAVKQPLHAKLAEAGMYSHNLQGTYEVRKPEGETTYRHTLNLSSLNVTQLVTVLQSLLPEVGTARVGECTLSGLSTSQAETLIESVARVKGKKV